MEQQSTIHEASGGFPNLVKIRLHNVLSEVGQAFTLFFQTLFQIFRPPFQFDLLVKQLLLIGFNSLAVVIVSGFFTGMVLGVSGVYSTQTLCSGRLGGEIRLCFSREGTRSDDYCVCARRTYRGINYC